MRGYFSRVALAIDILIMTLCNGERGETISSCAWSMEQDGKALGKILRPTIDFLSRWDQRHHCQSAYIYFERSKSLMT